MDQNNLDLIEPFAGFDHSHGQLAAGVPATLPEAPLQQTKTSYTTAVRVQEPRSISRTASNVLHEASLAGASFYYRWPVKDRQTGETKFVEGPSIDLAMCLIRNYGNCALDIQVEEKPDHYLFKGIMIDLESGLTSPRLFRQRKSQKMGRYDNQRAEDVVFQIGQSKALRNAITQAMPSWLIEKAIEKAKAAQIGSIRPENIAAARAQCIEYFRAYGITPERIEQTIGRKADNWTREDIANLRGNATAIKEGRISADALFPEIQKKPEPEIGDESNKKDDRWQDSAWDIENWRNLKSPGVMALAMEHRDTFHYQPIEVRKQFQIKWSQCRDVGPYPFTEDGDWIGLGTKKTNGTDFEQWLIEAFPDVDTERFKKYLDVKSSVMDEDIPSLTKKMQDDFDFAINILDGFNAWLVDSTITGPAIEGEETNG